MISVLTADPFPSLSRRATGRDLPNIGRRCKFTFLCRHRVVRGLNDAFVLADRVANVPSAQCSLNPFGGDAGDMSVTTGSLGTADVPASNPSLHGLDGVNFFLAAMLTGFGPCVVAYLANEMRTTRLSPH